MVHLICIRSHSTPLSKFTLKTLNTPVFIADRLRFPSGSVFSATVIRIAKISIALGIAILIVSLLIYAGFRNEIEQKMCSTGGHISLRQFTTGTLYEEKNLDRNAGFIQKLLQIPEVAHIQTFAYKPALLRTENEVEGVILKGIANDFNFSAFSVNTEAPVTCCPMAEGVWISTYMANKLGLKSGSEIVLFFLEDPPRYRKMKVELFFQTGLEEIDQNLVFVNQQLIQDMNGWAPNEVGGFEVFVKDFDAFERVWPAVESALPYQIAAEPITETQVQLFDWLQIIGRNVLVMFVLISLVSGFNMVATLLIMVMERRQMVGILKAMGAGNPLIRQIFYRNGINIIWQGLLWGNAIGLFLSFLQFQFHLVPLDPANYYVSSVPIAWNWAGILFINLGVISITSFMLLFPVRFVNRIKPSEAVRSV